MTKHDSTFGIPESVAPEEVWRSDAERYARNANFWQGRAETLQSEVTAYRMILIILIVFIVRYAFAEEPEHA